MSARLSGKIKNEKRPSKKRIGPSSRAAGWGFRRTYGKNNKSPGGGGGGGNERAHFFSFLRLFPLHHPLTRFSSSYYVS